LTEADVCTIRSLSAARDMKQIEIARLFGITREHVRVIVLRKCWKHIP
jgi:predicted XRE-type DNA-binding protein